MKIIISPAKKMINTSDDFLPESTPVFLNDAQILLDELQSYTRSDLKEVLKCNDQLLELNRDRFQTMNLKRNLSCALMSYVGLQYQHMGSQLFSLDELEYLQDHLRILSGFYGILKPMDGIVCYRLEMQAKLKEFDLYSFWNSKIAEELCKEEKLILNLASKEYAQAIKPYLKEDVHIVDVDFVTEKNGKLVTKATEAKMARGSMVRYCAVHRVTSIAQLHNFNEYGYCFVPELSNEHKLTFRKK